MNATTDRLPEQVERSARDWFVLIQSDTVGTADKDRFETWLNADPGHRAAYRQLDVIWDQLAMLSETPEGARLRRSVEGNAETGWFSRLLQPAASGGFFFNRPLGAAAAFALLAVSAGLVWLQSGNQIQPDVRYATATGEVRLVQLSDGSEVTLGAESEVLVAFHEQTRLLQLLDGEAFFDVTSDPNRPFVVEVNDFRVTVVGTQFDVRKRYAGADVAVLEGRVEVAANGSTANSAATQVLLSAGEQVSKPRGGAISAIEPISTVEFGAWRNGRLIFRNTHLIDVISDANRYFDGSISLLAREFYEEEVTLTLRTDQIDRLPAMLAMMDLPIEVRELPEGRITIIRATGDNP